MRFLSTGMIGLLLASSALYGADDTRPRHSLKQEQASLGTNIKRDVATGSVLPLDKTYGNLSDVEKSYVKSQYEEMGPNDEPPFPANGLRPIYRAIAAGQQKLLVTGTLSLAVAANEQGDATSISVLQSPDPQMTQ